MALQELVRRRAEKVLDGFCSDRVPAHLRDEIRIEYEFRGNSVTIVERRVPSHPAREGQPWTRMPIAQFRSDLGTGRWTLYWPGRNNRWHVDDDIDPASDLPPLLAEVDRDPTGIYWG